MTDYRKFPVLVMPKNPLRPEGSGNDDFYKQTDTESTYGGATAFLRGLYNAKTSPSYQNEMFHVHIPSLRQTNPPTVPVTFVKNLNGKYNISQRFDKSGIIPYPNNGMENIISNWCINVEIPKKKTRKNPTNINFFPKVPCIMLAYV